jgi:hypothetical protein
MSSFQEITIRYLKAVSLRPGKNEPINTSSNDALSPSYLNIEFHIRNPTNDVSEGLCRLLLMKSFICFDWHKLFNMKNELLPPIESLSQMFATPTKNKSSKVNTPNKDSTPSKLPPNAKIVGNYLLGK